MKISIILSMTALLVACGSAKQAGSSRNEISFWVRGNCGMCEERIEASIAYVPGVIYGEWDRSTELLTVEYRTKKTTVEEIKARIARAGHDVEGVSADEEVYNALPRCCKYERSVNN